MKNTQAPEKQFSDPRGAVDVHHIFRTIQGEGPYTGDRAIFIRLAGCNLQCPGCDTEYTGQRMLMLPGEIIKYIETNFPDYPKNGLIVVSGGEPFRQRIGPMLCALVATGYLVQIESNGVREPDEIAQHLIAENDVILVVSPKTSKISDVTKGLAHVFKYVLRDGDILESDGLPIHALEHPAVPYVARPRDNALVMINPYDEKDDELNRRHLAAAVASCNKHGYRLGIQLHKFINVE